MEIQHLIINLTQSIDKLIIEAAKNEFRDMSHFHASSWDGCKRQTAYAYYEAKGFIKTNDNTLKISPQLQRIFGNGHGVHDRWKTYFCFTKALMGYWLCTNWNAHKQPKIYGTNTPLGCLRPETCECGSQKFEYNEIGFLDEETLWGGHVDAVIDQKVLGEVTGNKCNILDDERYVIVDLKSINTFNFKALEAPKSEHITQMQIYLYLSKLKYGKFIYEDKNDQSVKEFLVTADPVFIQVKKSEALELKRIVTLSPDGKHRLPVRGYSSKTDEHCLKCKYRGDCWAEKHTTAKQPIVVTPPKATLLAVGDL